MTAYLEKVKAELRNFPRHEVKHIDREDNANADALAKLATSRDVELLRLVPIEIVAEPSITKQSSVKAIDAQPSWMDDIVIYLKDDRLPEDRDLARKVRYHAEHERQALQERDLNPIATLPQRRRSQASPK